MSDLKFDYPDDEPVVILTRSFDAPRALVWRIFTEPQHIARWWGPQSFAPIKSIDRHELRPGGAWRYVCAPPDGSPDIIFHGEYLEVSAPHRLANSFGLEGMFSPDPAFPETHTFEERAGRTYYRSHTLMPSFDTRQSMLDVGMEAGSREAIGQLDTLLAELAPAPA